MTTAEAYLKYAKRVAFNMWKDPEAESIAGAAAWYAMRTYNPEYGVPTKRWVAKCVKRYIWDFWRRRVKRREEFHTELWWEHVIERTTEQTEHLNPADMKLLHEYYIEGWCLDVVARRYGITKYAAKQRINAAVARLQEVVCRS